MPVPYGVPSWAVPYQSGARYDMGDSPEAAGGGVRAFSTVEYDPTPEAVFHGDVCNGTTKTGHECQSRPVEGTGFCVGHWRGVFRFCADTLTGLSAA